MKQCQRREGGALQWRTGRIRERESFMSLKSTTWSPFISQLFGQQEYKAQARTILKIYSRVSEIEKAMAANHSEFTK